MFFDLAELLTALGLQSMFPHLGDVKEIGTKIAKALGA